MTANLTIDQTAVIGAQVPVTPGPDSGRRSEIIAGYELEERIGVGGYGEVWRAVGPGGLPKAVKILHGQHDGPQADAELKALERMRDLRHPFLINIERVEVIEDRLIMVTELADGSLEARFKQLQREGHAGIPRDELLGYLRDAADALDFLFDRHGLQHLDVKPSNLLLMGDHLKIADFGLIKDIRQTNVSLVGGFTPLYAPPELFEGRPGRSSDQYSLAIVYQMMLTGTPPFGGRTAAQLTAQHLNSPPDLNALPLSDRAAVARAMSKKPTARFESCRDFVDRLAERTPRENGMRSAHVTHRQPSSGTGRGAIPSDAPPSTVTTRRQVPLPELESVPLPPVDTSRSPAVYRPTVFLGLGGLGGRVLRVLRQRFADRFGAETPLPAFPLLYIDTDAQAISASRSGDADVPLDHDETLAIPLRAPTDYRAYADELLHWLSRRWLYNIPKSRQVEGIRPLGRLALVDHHETIRQRIRQLLETAGGEDAIRRTSEITGLKFEGGPPHVVLVASISGGTGSGGVLDAAYLVRDVAAKLDFKQIAVSAVLLSAPGSRSQTRQLELANTVACLRELEEYSAAPARYPGDATCQLPCLDSSPFEDTWFLCLGDELDAAAFERELEKTAEYLHRRAATPARLLFEACRRQGNGEAGQPGDTAILRTFGVMTRDGTSDENTMLEADRLCQALLRRWRGTAALSAEGRPASDPDVAGRTRTLFGKLRLDAEDVAALVTAMTQGDLGKRIDAYFQARWAKLQNQNDQPAGDLGPVLDAIDREYADQQTNDGETEHPATVLRHLQKQLNSSAQKCVQAFQGELLAIIDGTVSRLDGACEALGDVIFQIDATSGKLRPLIEKIRSDLEQLKRSANQDSSGPNDTKITVPRHGDAPDQRNRALFRRYCMLKFYEGTWLCSIAYLRSIRDGVSQTAPPLKSLRDRLQKLQEHFGVAIESRANRAPAAGGMEHEPRTPPESSPVVPEHLAAFDEWLRAGGKIGPAGLAARDENRGCKAVADTIRNQALEFLATRGLASTSPTTGSSLAEDEQANFAEAVAPRLRGVGGGRRVLGVAPQHMISTGLHDRLADEFDNCVTLQPSGGNDFFCCYEVEGIALRTVIDRIAHEHSAVLDMAARLHTRVDIGWGAGT